MKTFALVVAGSFWVIGTVLAQKPTRPVDDSNIRWHLPGSFEAARRRAVDENRLLVIKGISFGVDSIGATCATKGTW